MRLSDYRGEKAIDVLADLIEPCAAIFTDADVRKAFESNDKPQIIAQLLRKHKSNILKVMAIVDGENPETYNPSLPSIPIKILELLNDPEIADLFSWQAQKTENASSGSASGNTQD